MTYLQFIEVGVAMVLGCALQGAVGFGAGMFAIPLMLWAGVDLPSAIAVMIGGVTIQCGWNLYRYQGYVTIRELMPMFVLRSVTLPVGVVLLGMLVKTIWVKQTVGGIILLALLMQWLLKVKPREHLAWGWLVLAGAASGVLTGLVGMGGPPVVLWVMAHDWPGRKARSYMWATFFLLIPFCIAVFVIRFGPVIWKSAFFGLCLAPLVIAGSELGQRLGGLMNRHRLRAVALAMLLVLALVSILGPILNISRAG